jgi:hypothetical protein
MLILLGYRGAEHVHWLGIVDLTNLLLHAEVGYLEPAEKGADKTILEGFWPWSVVRTFRQLGVT